jgi:predicted MFS family arabinose efflux permease
LQPTTANYKWILAGTLFFASAINYADRTSVTSVYALLKTELGFTDVALGAMGTLFLWSYALASPVAGYLGDRFSRSRLIVWSLAGWSLVTLLTGFAATPWQLLSMRVLLGVVEAAYLPAAFALVAEYHGAETRGTALGLLALGNSLGMVGGATLAGYLGQSFGWRVPLLTLGVVGLLWAVVCWFVLPLKQVASAPARLSMGTSVGTLLRVPSILVLIGAGLLTAIGTWVFINWLPLYFHENFGLSLARAGFLGSSLVGITGALTLGVGGYVSDRLARGGAHRRMWMQAILILCAAPVLLTFLVTRNQMAVMAALVVYSVLRTSADVNIIPLLCDLAGNERRSTAVGLTNMLNTLAGGAGVFVAGALKSNVGLDGVFASVAAILALDSALLFAGCVLFLKRDLARAAAT